MKKYVILNVSELDSVDFNQVIEVSADTLSYSVDGTKTFVKFEGEETPSFLVGKPQHNHAQILEILSGPEWTSAEEV
jgi:hypothetical protein